MATSNGCEKAVRKRYTDLKSEFRTTPRYLATIDFGTTHCSVAYLCRPDLAPKPSEVDPTLLKLDDAGRNRIPSCILFDNNGNKLALGYVARERFAAMDHTLRPQYLYFEHVKRHLQHEKNIDRNRKIKAMNGTQCYLMDVIAHILHELKLKLLTGMRDFGYKDMKASDFDWVITVPAIWKSKGKRMMREAGYKAGLCSNESPEALCPATRILNPPSEEVSPEKLSLALEPESAALHCRHKAKEAGKSSEYSAIARSYIVVDIGGGTVDITSHAIVGGSIEELAVPVGNFWGGTTVNESFSRFLQDFVNDPEFSCYIGNGDIVKRTRHKADLNNLIYARFETQKMCFGSGETRDDYTVEFPYSFLRQYENIIVEKGKQLNLDGNMDVRIEDEGAVMRIRASKMAKFFQLTIDGIVDLITSHLNRSNLARTIDTIYWVGGFGGCSYLREQLEGIIKVKYRGFQYQFLVPPEPDLAVIRGATAFRCDPAVVTKRKADATYGTGCSIPFNPAIHLPNLKFRNEETQVDMCGTIFCSFVEKGDDICTNEVFVTDFSSRSRNQTSATFTLYSAPRKDVWYTTDDDVCILGKMTVDMGGRGLNRQLEIVCDITHTEIQVRLRDKTSGNMQNIVLDFLTSR